MRNGFLVIGNEKKSFPSKNSTFIACYYKTRYSAAKIARDYFNIAPPLLYLSIVFIGGKGYGQRKSLTELLQLPNASCGNRRRVVDDSPGYQLTCISTGITRVLYTMGALMRQITDRNDP